MQKDKYIYDIETFKYIFCVVFKSITTDESFEFEISSRIHQWKGLKIFLNSCKGLIGFNNVGFDYPVLHKMLKYKGKLTSEIIHGFSQEVISSDRTTIWKPKVPQLDLFLIHHYNNPARSCSLKWLEFSLRWHKVQDLPFKHDEFIPIEEFDNVIKYCHNDVNFTYEIYKKSLTAIKFRGNTTRKLNHNVMNYSDVKIGEYINQITYEKLSKKPYKTFKDLRTLHSSFIMKDIIPPQIKFKSKIFNDFYDSIKDLIFYPGQDINRYIKLPGITIKFAKGGLHSEDKPRIVKNTKGYLQEKDIGSMYPWTIVSECIYPAHLGVEWNQGIKQSYNYRANVLKPKLKTLKKGSDEYSKIDAEQGVYKLSMNGGGFGKLGSEFSWQCDELAKYKVTIGGELKMLMLIEDFYLADIELISVNTDGVVIHYTEEQKPIVDLIHKNWEELTTYTLEDTDYKQLIFSTVNDYIAEIIDPITKETLYNKYKGDFGIDVEWHKNNSQRIIPIALSKYFIEGIPIIETIKNHTDIFDFCIGRKARGSFYWLSSPKYDNPIKVHDKVLRYYISNNSVKLYKESTSGKSKGSISAVNKGFNITLFMDYKKKDIKEYNINYEYYIAECNKIIKPIEKQKNTETVIQGLLF